MAKGVRLRLPAGLAATGCAASHTRIDRNARHGDLPA
jgi:hypothetical protein